jgi:hypothetical protein
MVNCSMMKNSDAATKANTPKASSSPMCVITFSPVTSPRSPSVVQVRHAQTFTVAAISPMALPTPAQAQTTILAAKRDSYALSTSCVVASHGLRAPPVA